jgi:xanthine dehydrogenase accessory factor
VEDILLKIAEVKRAGKKAALCIIVGTKGSSPRKSGSKMIVYPDKTIEGTIGGGSLEFKVTEDALKVMNENLPQKFVYQLEQDLSMHCGGIAEVYIEPIKPLDNLYIFGTGHIGKALAKYAQDFGFSTFLIDPRSDTLEKIDFPGIQKINEDFISAAQRINFHSHDYIVIVTPKHAFDEEVLAVCAKKSYSYIGMIGSKTKISLARKRMVEEKILNEKDLDRVDMPIGIKFNAQTPEEIAISILAKLIDVKNRAKG